MSITTDYHLHTCYSVDCDSDLQAMCARALDLGLERIIFTEHKDFIYELGPYKDFFSYADYMQAIEAARQKFGSRIRILAGIEVDFTTDYTGPVKDFVRDHEFDFFIGSVHYLGHEPISETRADVFFKQAPREEVIPFYFRELKACAATGLFDTIGHLDMIKRFSIPFYGPFRADEWMDAIREILIIMLDTDTALEINTSGWRHDPQEQYPCREILDVYRDLGGKEVTVGSDAHLPEHVGYRFDDAYKIINEYDFELKRMSNGS